MAVHNSTQSKFIGVSRTAPFGVYIDGEKITEYENQAAALNHYNELVGQAQKNTGGFSDRRVILTTHDDNRLAQVSYAPFRHEQSCDGPQYIVIRHNATDEVLMKAAARFGIPIRDLTEFRAHKAR